MLYMDKNLDWMRYRRGCMTGWHSNQNFFSHAVFALMERWGFVEPGGEYIID